MQGVLPSQAIEGLIADGILTADPPSFPNRSSPHRWTCVWVMWPTACVPLSCQVAAKRSLIG